jgi:hypothetical protein
LSDQSRLKITLAIVAQRELRNRSNSFLAKF